MFRTELTIGASSFKIDHSHKLLTIGSCFSQVIGERLAGNKFDALVNPFGTVFNPVSIFRLLQASMDNDLSAIDAFVENRGSWFNYHVHSDFYGTTKEELSTKIKAALQTTQLHLQQSNVLIITLGTAFVYRLQATQQIVANCHKVPAQNFTKELLSVKEIVEAFSTLYSSLEKQGVKILLTVSPVRHTKDTLPLNSVSKATLVLACHELSQTLENVFYFPAYEIMVDDLRDYRFYKADMIHPTEVAEEYIWNKFSDSYFEEDTKQLLKEWSSVSKALQHKPFREDSAEHQKFLIETLKRLQLLKNKINVEQEINELSQRTLNH